MRTETMSPMVGGPFRLLKYFIISGFAVITIVTFLLSAFLYTRSIDALLSGSESYAKLLAENLNYNIYNGFYAPLKARGTQMDLSKWDQFGALDSLIKDFTYGLKTERIKVLDLHRRIVYCSDYSLIGKTEPANETFQESLKGRARSFVRREDRDPDSWIKKWQVRTYFPLREITGNFWMLGNIYGVMEITQDVTDQYLTVQKSLVVVIAVAVVLMGFLFIVLTLIVRRGEKILIERANERKQLEERLQQSEKLASVGRMVATIAHEIRNPLGIIKSSAEMLHGKKDPVPARVNKLSGVIVEEATRLSAILTDFLEFAKPRSPDLRNVDLRQVLMRARENLDQEMRSRNIEWREEETDGMNTFAVGDPDLLYQAFLNITMNAFEAMEGGGALSIGIHNTDSKVMVSFRDNGHGIKDADLPRIFTPFFTTHEMGTGLGLSVVHNIITAHGGQVSVESREGRGTVFTVG
ncbi:MAG: ATP-binding protein, partial [Pseudomonadota bacterium]